MLCVVQRSDLTQLLDLSVYAVFKVKWINKQINKSLFLIKYMSGDKSNKK